MRLAFYAPLKPPDHPVPSGDRRTAQLLVQAWEKAGHHVEIASGLASRRRDGAQQAEVAAAAVAERQRLLALYGARPAGERPAAWFTYHLYYKAPDWLGPDIARALAIPYLVAEASVAGKRAGVTSYAAGLLLATTRLDVNGVVRARLDARKASFAPLAEVVELTAMEYGGITVLGLPGWPVLVDSRVVAHSGMVVIGSGIRGSKLALPAARVADLATAEVIERLAG